MKLRCGPTPEERAEEHELRNKNNRKYLTNWHDFYAIWPRQVGSYDCRCFETIQRKFDYCKGDEFSNFKDIFYNVQYRAKDDVSNTL